MNELERIKQNVRMKLAALRQFLRDRSEYLTETERDEILDEMNKYLTLIEEIEKLEKRGLS